MVAMSIAVRPNDIIMIDSDSIILTSFLNFAKKIAVLSRIIVFWCQPPFLLASINEAICRAQVAVGP